MKPDIFQSTDHLCEVLLGEKLIAEMEITIAGLTLTIPKIKKLTRRKLLVLASLMHCSNSWDKEITVTSDSPTEQKNMEDWLQALVNDLNK